MPTIEIRFSAYCSVCGAGICNNVMVDDRYDLKINIEPCEKCLETSRSKAYDGGYEEGYEEGFKEGYEAADGK